MKPYRLYIFDLDGTLYRGEEVLPGAVEAVAALRHRGAVIRYLTNNSGRSREHYAEKLTRLGFSAEPAEVYSSAQAAARVCSERGYREAFVVGEEGLFTELAVAGMRILNSGQSEARPFTGQRGAVCVVAGICRNFTYAWMNEAMQHILSGATFFATNTDSSYPLEGGRLEPGAGAIVSSIQTCSGRAPEVLGKPNRLLVDMILADAGRPKDEALVVGDRIETDIEAGRRAGCDTFLVLSGVTSEPPQEMAAGYTLMDLVGG